MRWLSISAAPASAFRAILSGCFFQADESDRGSRSGDVAGDGPGKGRLPHRRPARRNHGLAGADPADDCIERAQSGADERRPTLPDRVIGVRDGFRECEDLPAGAVCHDPAGHIGQLAGELGSVRLPGHRAPGNVVGSADDRAKGSMFADALGVLRPMCGGGNGPQDLCDVRAPADPIELIELLQLVSQDDRVKRPAGANQVRDRVEDHLVICQEKALAAERRKGLQGEIRVDHQRGDQAHFRLDRVRRKVISCVDFT
jgi:hypothetical protein